MVECLCDDQLDVPGWDGSLELGVGGRGHQSNARKIEFPTACNWGHQLEFVVTVIQTKYVKKAVLRHATSSDIP